MKQFSFTITFIFFVKTALGQKVNDDFAFFNYNYNRGLIKHNKVEVVIVNLYSKGISSGKIKFYFDTAGLLIKEIISDSSENIKREFRFTTNSHKQIVGRKQIDYEFNRTDSVKYFKIYDGQKLVNDSSSEMPVRYEYVYDKKGNLINSIVYSNFGSGNMTKRVTEYTIDGFGRPSKIIETVYQKTKDSIGAVFSNRNIFYNEKGNVIKETESLNNENSWPANKGSITYVYDRFENLVQILQTNAASYKFTYNKMGLITSKQTNITIDESNFETFHKYTYIFRK